MNTIDLAERRILPDNAIRYGIRRLISRRLSEEHSYDPDKQDARYRELLEKLKTSHIAIETDAANDQHYEVPADFFQFSLGKHLKYSACLWEESTTSLDEAEASMLDLYCQRAGLDNGQEILELGCGWGSLTLWMAERFPKSLVVGVSNSSSQRSYILRQARIRKLTNIRVITADINGFEPDRKFDRVVSIEMFEHVRNYGKLMTRISEWLKPGGKLFVHIFCHRYLMYPFETHGDDNWMGKYFFTGGLMPAADTLLHFQDRLKIEKQWRLSGEHYEKTAEAWLKNLDHNESEIFGIFATTYGPAEASRWIQRWRMFFMSCAELFGYRNGSEWLVTHYLFAKNDA
ncbi:MAG: cyclopropane-fatty-acyl-phospholipid synthase family protein [Gammaproteobacteria bacterium]|nr:cyclopropane-fatty-acyl-phospholipid synthase family protein [Gammaproteobacteria bacterium]